MRVYAEVKRDRMPGFPDPSPNPTDSVSAAADIELLVSLNSRDPKTLAALYDRFGRVVYSLAARLLSDNREIEEVTQDVFVALWKNPASYQPDKASPLTWFATITRNKCIDRLRKAGRRIPGTPDEIDHLVPVTDDNRSSNPIFVSAIHDLSRQIQECLGRLSPSQRDTVEFAYFDSLSMNEIAERCAIPTGTVKSRLRLALDKLRRCLRPRGTEQ